MANPHVRENIGSTLTNPPELKSSSPAPQFAPPADSVLARVLSEAAKGQYEKAIKLAQRESATDMNVANAQGVCLLRLGKYDEAVKVFRGLVLNSGCTWMRKDRPLHFKTNFATALLLSGHPSGCLQVLAEVRDQSPPVADALRGAIKKWRRGLPFWAWLNWTTSRIEPEGYPVKLDFQPGDFESTLSIELPSTQHATGASA